MQQLAYSEAKKASDALFAQLGPARQIADAFEQRLSAGEIAKKDVIASLKRTFDANPVLFAMGVAYRPFAYDGKHEFYSPYFDRTRWFDRPEMLTGYTGKGAEYAWYNEAMNGKAVWTEPYFEPVTDVLMTTYATPFYAVADKGGSGRKPLGVLGTDINLAEVHDSMAKMKLGDTGFGFIVSRQGSLISHPIYELVRNRTTLKELAQEPDQSHLKEVVDRLHTPKRADFDFFKVENATTGQLFRIGLYRMPLTDWTLVVELPEQEGGAEATLLRRLHIALNACTVLSLFLLVSIIFRVDRFYQIRWRYVGLVSLIFTIGIGAVWIVAKRHTSLVNDTAITIYDEEGLSRFIGRQESLAHDRHVEPPLFIPTGLHIQSLEFTSANNVFVTGYIWQNYPQKLPDGIEKGFIFPESISLKKQKVYSKPLADSGEVSGWYFEVTLRQPFDYTKYPFDKQDVWLRIWHRNFDRNVILVPQLGSYELSYPAALPGIEEHLVLPEWDVRASYFSYQPHNYNTNFGIESYVGQYDFPELYFTARIQRKFIEPFIANLLPFFVIMVLVFASSLNYQREASTSAFITECGAMLFSVLLAHYSLRERIESTGFVYFENFYFIAYAAILVLIIYALAFKGERFQLENDTLANQLYWPAITGILFVLTVITFF